MLVFELLVLSRLLTVSLSFFLDRVAELNDFIAHEVRNPLAAAISACSFVSRAIMEDPGIYNSSSDINISNNEGTETERLALIA